MAKGERRAATPEHLARAGAHVPPGTMPPDVRAALQSSAALAVEVMTELLEIGDAREKADAARVLLQAWGAIQKTPPEPEKPLTPAEREAKVRELMATPEVQAWMATQGWTRPVTP